jgi:hypothetical protein
MRIEAGKELEFIGHRLVDVIFFAEKTEPVNGDLEGYMRECLKMIAQSARDAQTALTLLLGSPQTRREG